MTEKKEDEDKTLAEKQGELVAVEEAEEKAAESAAHDDAGHDDAGADDEKDDDAVEGDARASSEAGAEAEEGEDGKKSRKESYSARRKRQREARARLERELEYYRGRNEQLERRFSDVEARQTTAERLTLQQAIERTEQQLAEARKIESEAIKEADGESAVEARSIGDALEAKRARLLQAKTRAEQPRAAADDKTPPPAMRAAFEWIKANKAWYDPQGGDEDSRDASAMEEALTREGRFNPATPAFWSELDRRLGKRGIGKRPSVDIDDGEDDDVPTDGAPRRAKSETAREREDARTPSTGGPKISVGGTNRALKAHEVYVSPERKKAMQEAGVWDDPVLRQQMLKRYQTYDREARSER